MGQFSNPVATHPRTNEVEVPPRANKAGILVLFHIIVYRKADVYYIFNKMHHFGYFDKIFKSSKGHLC